MTRSLDVLVMENHRGASRPAEEELTAAGHRVHRCHEPGDRGFPCVGITHPGSCPIDQRVDVALLVRDRVSPRPQPLEEGMSCAIRAGVPVVEQGNDILDPYGPWVSERVAPGLGVTAACERAAAGSFDALRTEIGRRTRAVLTAAGVDPDQVRCHVEPEGAALRVELRVDDLHEYMRESREPHGMQTFDQHLADLVFESVITHKTGAAAASDEGDFESQMKELRKQARGGKARKGAGADTEDEDE